MAAPIKLRLCKGQFNELANTMCFTGRNHVIVWLSLLQHQPHCFHIISGVTPIALCAEVPKIQLVLKSLADPSDGTGNLPSHECFSAARALMVEQDAIADEEVVSFAIIYRKPMSG